MINMRQKKQSRLRTLALSAFLVLSSLLFSQNTHSGFPLSPAATKTLVDSLANQVSKYYVEKDAAVKISALLRKKLKEGAYNKIADPHQLAGQLTSDVLSAHRDEHFHIEYNPSLANEVSGNVEDVPKMVAEKLQADRSRNFGFRRTEILTGNIGYLELSGFSRLNKYSRETADAALRMLSNSSAIIIDLRYGVGGSPEMVNYILSHFLKEKTHVADIYIRSENATIPYYTTPDSTFSALFEIPLYVLTSYKTFSAAEGLTYALQSLGRATIIGETTRGGAHTVTYRPLSSGFVADIPFGKATDPRTKSSWELTGIKPDVQATADNAPEVAESLIFDKKLRSCSDSLQLRNVRMQRELLNGMHHPVQVDSLHLQQYSGQFGVYNISVHKGELFYQKTGKAKFPMVPMRNDQFRAMGNDTFIIRFSRSADGRVNGVTTTYDDGREESAIRNSGS